MTGKGSWSPGVEEASVLHYSQRVHEGSESAGKERLAGTQGRGMGVELNTA